ncbi:hypothetical protein GCM10022222_38670 [Amycolatopsis ultiminotia]|uniref:ABC transporter permease n=1 Tax=Amycolatopsis ultiminotia TaxID=543629 RepID=A0ABP6WIJ9_9PSEU
MDQPIVSSTTQAAGAGPPAGFDPAATTTDTVELTTTSFWQPPSQRTKLLRSLSFRNVSAVYLFVVMLVLFALSVPETFLTSGVWRALVSGQSITCLVAVGLVPALAAGVFDLAAGGEVGLGAIVVAWLLVSGDLSPVFAIVVTLLAGALVGVLNWFLIVRLRIQSFIATLGVSSILLAAIEWVSHDQQILALPSSFNKLGSGQFLGLQIPVFVLAGVAVVVWVRHGAHVCRAPRICDGSRHRGCEVGWRADLPGHSAQRSGMHGHRRHGWRAQQCSVVHR